MIHGTSSLPKSSEEFVKKYSIPAHFAEVSEVEELLRPLGLHRQRARAQVRSWNGGLLRAV